MASEAAPFAKTGGLGDVVGALPRALVKRGVTTTTILPRYPQTLNFPQKLLRSSLTVPLGTQLFRVDLFEGADPHSGHRVLFLDHPALYERSGIYVDSEGKDYSDNLQRFALLCRGAIEAAAALDLAVDCFHGHDWPAGLVPAYLCDVYTRHPKLAQAASIFTIHNVVFQGIVSKAQCRSVGLGKSAENFVAYHGNASLLRAGITASDWVTTVSRQYALEIQTPELGCGMEDVLVARGPQLTGIVNGIDTTEFDPRTDDALAMNYGASDWRTGKHRCKVQLLGNVIPSSKDFPLVGMVGRLTEQKGLDLVLKVADELFDGRLRMVILGTGDERFEKRLDELAKQYPDRLTFWKRFDEPLARRIYAGCDMLLMPSRFEPCGLAQLYAMRYGTVPIVHAVGGLVDTVVPVTSESLANRLATGFAFREYSSEALMTCVDAAMNAYDNPETWARIVQRGMSQDWSWDNAATQYHSVYEQAMRRRNLSVKGPQ